MGWLLGTLILIAALVSGGVFGLYKMRVDIPALNTAKIYAHLDSLGPREKWKGYILGRYESYFHKHGGEAHQEHDKIVVTTPMARDVIITQEFVCQIHSRRHIDVCALEDGYLEGHPNQGRTGGERGRCDVRGRTNSLQGKVGRRGGRERSAQLELNNTQRLSKKQGVSENEVKLFEAKLARAQAKADLAEAELNFTRVKAPFDGIIDRLKTQQGSLVKEGDILTTLSDNRVMWVYFNVPEAQYLEYMAQLGRGKEGSENRTQAGEPQQVPKARLGSDDRGPNSTMRPGTSPSGRILRTPTTCYVTVRPAPS